MAPEQPGRASGAAATLITPETDATLLSVWQMLRTAPDAYSKPAELPVVGEEWTVAAAPGTVASALRDAGNGDWRDTSNLDDHDWWYRCHFRCEHPEVGASLEFGGLATLADVWLNGTHVLSSDNMFVAHSIDPGASLRRDNDIAIRFRSLTAELKTRRPRPRWRTRLASHQNLRWIRTTLLGRMPGWSASAQPIGPWKSISLIPHDAARIISREIHARLDQADGIVSVSACVSLPAGATISSATITIGTVKSAAVVRSSGNDFVVNASIRIPDAQIWWPHTHGEQPLYDAIVTLTWNASTAQIPLGRVAFRRVDLVSNNGQFRLLINDERVFWRGACWSPPDALRLHCTRAEYRRTLELARNAGMNMLRIGGTMVYEHDDFYDLCDELGIAVWQDLMFANMDYPDGDAAFGTSAGHEVSQFLQRVASHASLLLVCGNSEVEQQAAMLGLPSSEWRSSLFSERFADLVAEHVPEVPYWPSSPSGGDLPFHVNAGDGHYFGYGPYLRPPSDVRASAVQFASECLALSNVPEPAFVDSMPCGATGAGHHPDWKLGVPRDNGAGWDFEDVRDHYVKELFAVDPAAVRYADPERYLALGRVAGGELMMHTIAEWRRAESPCSGALVWMYRDLRPGAGWGILDHDGLPKAAYYYLARAYRPITVVMTDEGLNGIGIHAINDSAHTISPRLRLSLMNGAISVGDATTQIELAAHSSLDLSADEVMGSFTDVSYAYRFGRPHHDAIIATLLGSDDGELLAEAFHFSLGIGSPRATTHLETRVERISDDSYLLAIRADTLAIAVSIEVRGWAPSDNYFNVAPGRERMIVLSTHQKHATPSGRITALNSSSPTLFHAG